jgi:osmotically-inducible protein OsmY
MHLPWKAGARGLLLPAAALLMVACASTAPKSAAVARTDDLTAELVYTALRDDHTFYFRHVDVSVEDGVAHLSGLVWTQEALFEAQRVAGGVPGVVRVVNAMELVRPGVRGGSG